VSVDEVVLCVNMVLGTPHGDSCSFNGATNIAAITSAVAHLLNGCP
jgi:hypothetical protein